MKQIDRIRKLNADELAQYMWTCCASCIYNSKNCPLECVEGHIKWLESEAEERK